MRDHRAKKNHRASHHFPFKDDQHVVTTGIRAKINFARGSKKRKKKQEWISLQISRFDISSSEEHRCQSSRGFASLVSSL